MEAHSFCLSKIEVWILGGGTCRICIYCSMHPLALKAQMQMTRNKGLNLFQSPIKTLHFAKLLKTIVSNVANTS